MSSLRTTTKNALVDYFNNTGFTVTNDVANTRNGMWTLECNQCQTDNEVRVATLFQLKRTYSRACCVSCKQRAKVDNFLNRCDMNEIDNRLIDDRLIDDRLIDDRLIECVDCELRYNYCGDYFDFFKCYCRLQIKDDEHVVYKFLQETFPDAIMAKEILYRVNHKVDICLRHEGKRFLIEIDDDSHFARSKKTQKLDKRVMDVFLQENEENVFFIRIPINAIYKPDFRTFLEDFIKTVENDNARILVFQVSGLNRYLPLEIPENEMETCRV